MYHFEEQLKLGKEVENALDLYFSKWYTIQEVSIETEIAYGYDRIFCKHGTEITKLIEYKADWKTALTGNFFIELNVVSDSGREKNGWALHSKADIVIYAVLMPDNSIKKLYFLSPRKIQQQLQYLKQFKKVECFNPTWHSVGLLVPVTEYARIMYND